MYVDRQAFVLPTHLFYIGDDSIFGPVASSGVEDSPGVLSPLRRLSRYSMEHQLSRHGCFQRDTTARDERGVIDAEAGGVGSWWGRGGSDQFSCFPGFTGERLKGQRSPSALRRACIMHWPILHVRLTSNRDRCECWEIGNFD